MDRGIDQERRPEPRLARCLNCGRIHVVVVTIPFDPRHLIDFCTRCVLEAPSKSFAWAIIEPADDPHLYAVHALHGVEAARAFDEDRAVERALAQSELHSTRLKGSP